MAVPAAVLYTRAQYAALAAALAGIRPTEWATRHINIPISDNLREELTFWLDLKTPLINGAHWILWLFRTPHREGREELLYCLKYPLQPQKILAQNKPHGI